MEIDESNVGSFKEEVGEIFFGDEFGVSKLGSIGKICKKTLE